MLPHLDDPVHPAALPRSCRDNPTKPPLHAAAIPCAVPTIMLFAIIATDRPGALDLRLATRPTHLAYLTMYVDRIVHGGPTLDLDGRPCGSLLIIDVEDRAAAEGFAAEDPYAKASLFESTVIRPFREVFRDGQVLA